MQKTNQRKPAVSSNGKTVVVMGDSMLELLFLDELMDIYWGERHLVRNLPKMLRAANSEELQQALAGHLDITREHVSRLEQVFKLLGQQPQAKKCEAMEGITSEADNIVENTKAGTATRDAGLILAAQKVEHYEIATYGGLSQLARTLRHDRIAEMLDQTLSEEKEADAVLTEIAENNINYKASQEYMSAEE
jgi:ferritin-like metal-binding protein YciE